MVNVRVAFFAFAVLVACGKSSSNQQSSGSASAPTCVDGTAADCEQNGKGKWTGAKCCVASPVTCTEGTAVDCEQNGKGKWTGAKCCL